MKVNLLRFVLVMSTFVSYCSSLPADMDNIIDATYGEGTGSFENGTYAGYFSGFMPVPPGSGAIIGWTVGGPGDGVDWLGWHSNADSGSFSVDLRHITASSISTTVPTVVGHTYEVSFRTATVVGRDSTGVVSIGEFSMPFSAPFSNGFGNQQYVTITFSFKAVSNTSTLRFEATGSVSPETSTYGPVIDTVSITSVTEPSSIAASFAYHDGWTGTGTPPWNHLDASKTLAKEGNGAQMLSYNNLINTAHGINGIVFDIQNLFSAGNLSVQDFEFQVSPQGAFDAGANPPASWQAAPVPSSITVTPGSPDRVLILWPDQSIMNRWLRVIVKASPNTGLSQPEVYYLGHLRGESTGPADSIFTVSFADITPIRAAVGSAVDASSEYDIDKNGTVSFADISAMRGNVGSQLPQIIVP